MEITDIRIYPFDTTTAGGHVLAYADVELDSQLLVRGIRLLQGEKGGLFIGYPSRKGKDEKYHDIIRPLTRDLQEEIREKVINAFQEYSGDV